jgi:hypothetical protein
MQLFGAEYGVELGLLQHAPHEPQSFVE